MAAAAVGHISLPYFLSPFRSRFAPLLLFPAFLSYFPGREGPKIYLCWENMGPGKIRSKRRPKGSIFSQQPFGALFRSSNSQKLLREYVNGFQLPRLKRQQIIHPSFLFVDCLWPSFWSGKLGRKEEAKEKENEDQTINHR